MYVGIFASACVCIHMHFGIIYYVHVYLQFNVIHIYIYTCIYIYIHTGVERERERFCLHYVIHQCLAAVFFQMNPSECHDVPHVFFWGIDSARTCSWWKQCYLIMNLER